MSHGARAPSSALAPSPAPHFPRRPRPSPIFCPGTISGYVLSAPPRPSPAFCPNYVFGSADLRRLRVIFCALASTLATRAPRPRTPAYSSARASPLFRPPAPFGGAYPRRPPLFLASLAAAASAAADTAPSALSRSSLMTFPGASSTLRPGISFDGAALLSTPSKLVHLDVPLRLAAFLTSSYRPPTML